jgi:hypothetical protein
MLNRAPELTLFADHQGTKLAKKTHQFRQYTKIFVARYAGKCVVEAAPNSNRQLLSNYGHSHKEKLRPTDV